MSSTPATSRAAEGVGLLLALAALALRLSLGAWPLDDAFITFRYAANASSGAGLVYNPGQLVLGTSTPLYAGLLAALAASTGSRDFPEIAAVVNAISDSISVLLMFWIARRLRLPLSAASLAAAVLAFSPLILRYSIGGMETSVLTMVSLAAVAAYLGRESSLPFHLAGAAVWIRPDALALWAALATAEGIRHRRIPWGAVAIGAAWAGVGALVLVLGYGEALPQSVLAKANLVYLVNPWTNLTQHLYLFSGLTLTGVQGFGARGLVINPSPSLTGIAVGTFALFLVAWIVGVVRLSREDHRTLVFPLYLGSFTAAYSLLGLRGSLMAEWYLVPLVPFWLVPLMGGFATIAARGAALPRRVAGQAGAVVLLALGLTALNWGRDPSRPLLLPLNVWNEREVLYAQAAAFLRANGDPQAITAASEIGALGYACGCRILDTVGLVSPEVMQFYPTEPDQLVGNYAVPRELVASLHPDFLVTLEVFIRKSLLLDPAFRDEYDIVWRAPTDAFGSRGLMIFARGDEPES